MVIRQLFVAVLCLSAISYQAVVEELEGIVAIVDEDVVLASELLSRLEEVNKQMIATNIEPPPKDILMSQLVERLIMESLLTILLVNFTLIGKRVRRYKTRKKFLPQPSLVHYSMPRKMG